MANHLIKKATLELVEGATKEEFDALSERVDNIVASQTADVSGFKIETEIATLQIYGTDTSMSNQFLLPLNSEIVEASYKIGGSAWIFDNISVYSSETTSVLAVTVSAEFEATGENLEAYIKLVYSYPETSNIQELTDIRIGYDGTVYGSAGEAVRRQIGALAYANSGFNEQVKAALLNLLSHVAFVDEHGQQYYDELEAAMNNALGVLSITAVFNQGQNVIYDTDSLNDLKQYLTVTAHYEDGTSREVTAYTLSGTLTEGTSTITVSYGGKTTTFDVTVSAGILFRKTDWAFTGGNLDTGVALCDTDADFSVAMDVVTTTNPSSGDASSYRLIRIIDADGSSYALAVYKIQPTATTLSFRFMSGVQNIGSSTPGRHRFVITHEQGSSSATIKYRKDDGTAQTVTLESAFVSSTRNLVLGQTSGVNMLPAGTLNDFIIYDHIMSAHAIDAFLGL